MVSRTAIPIPCGWSSNYHSVSNPPANELIISPMMKTMAKTLMTNSRVLVVIARYFKIAALADFDNRYFGGRDDLGDIGRLGVAWE